MWNTRDINEMSQAFGTILPRIKAEQKAGKMSGKLSPGGARSTGPGIQCINCEAL